MGIRNLEKEFRIEIDDEGRWILPAKVVSRYGLRPGSRVFLEDSGNGLCLRHPVATLAKVYIEPTNRCNLECRTCMRRVWDETLGEMSPSTFARILEGLSVFSPAPTIFFGGLGEPLAHPNIVEMVGQAKDLAGSVELITNGTMLTREMSRRLIDAGLDMLWVSLDGATPESYTDVRLGAALPEVLANIVAFRDARQTEYTQKAHIGIVFVAMKRNIADLPSLLTLSSQMGAKRFLVSNVLPYTAEMREEILYSRGLMDVAYGSYLELPIMDVSKTTLGPISQALRSSQSVAFTGNRLKDTKNRCPFIQSQATAISWEGDISPCLPLLHSHVSFLDKRERFSRRNVIGNVNKIALQDLWNAPEYITFRERVQLFDFSPCALCGGCELAEGNEEDCFGNKFPTCGGCLWAHGVIQCP